jgi:hypothetical protein
LRTSNNATLPQGLRHDEAGFFKPSEMNADGAMVHPERLDQIADCQRVLRRRDLAEDGETGLFSEGLAEL